jgi:ribonuclease P protein component
MLSLKNRIKRKKEFEEIFKTGENLSGFFFFLKIKENKRDFSRFAFVYPIKEEKRATKRNRGKRLFREVVRKDIPLLKKNIDGIFILKKGVEGKSYKEVKEDIERVFKKNNLI